MDYDDKTTEWLSERLAAADRRWEKAMAHPRYRDEPSDDKPFTASDSLRYFWADTWRKVFHEYENALYRRPEVRRGMVEGLTNRVPLTDFQRD